MKHSRELHSYFIVSFIIVSFISLIGCNEQKPVSQSSMPEDIIRQEYDLRERCGSYCIDYFHKVYGDKVKKSDNYTTHSDYVSHYNKKINKCYMLVKSQSHPNKAIGSIITTEHIIDVHENKIYGVFTISSRENVADVQKNKNIKEATISGKENVISECMVLDEKCKSKEEWDKMIKPYMDE
jgi:hypothetical protein